MPTATVASKGPTAVPKSIRDPPRLHSGTKIDFLVRSDGNLTRKPVRVDVRELCSILVRRESGRMIPEQMDDAIAAGAARGIRAL